MQPAQQWCVQERTADAASIPKAIDTLKTVMQEAKHESGRQSVRTGGKG